MTSTITELPRLPVTTRTELRAASGAGVHLAWDQSIYQSDQVAEWLISSGLGLVRDHYSPGSKHQESQLLKMGEAGVGLCLFVADEGTSPADAAKTVETLSKSPLAPYVRCVMGNNEPNGNGGAQWPLRAVAIQQAIYGATHTFLPGVPVLSPVLKRNVGHPPGGQQYTTDMGALFAAGVLKWIDEADMHFYPGNAGPKDNPAEQDRVRAAWVGNLPLWQSETGWTGADTPPDVAARFSLEALLRNHTNGIVATILYELCDESQFVKGREGLFGIRTSTDPKPAFDSVQGLLTPVDGGEEFPAPSRLSRLDDAQAVVTSDGDQAWTVYLLRNTNPSATLVIPPEYKADVGHLELGRAGNSRYSVDLAESMVEVHVTAA